jgi:hypothetical protein
MIGNFRLVSEAQIDALMADPRSIEGFLYDEEASEETELDIDKAWQGLHFLLTGTDWGGTPPLDFIIAGGQEVSDVDVGYGPARALRNAELKETVAALDPISAEILRERFDPPQMMKLGIYPEIWDRDPAEDDTLAYLVEYFEMLKPFLARGAASGLGVLIYVN